MNYELVKLAADYLVQQQRNEMIWQQLSKIAQRSFPTAPQWPGSPQSPPTFPTHKLPIPYGDILPKPKGGSWPPSGDIPPNLPNGPWSPPKIPTVPNPYGTPNIKPF